MEPMLKEKKLLRIHKVAKRLAVSPRTVYRLIKAGKLPSIHIGEVSVRVFDSDLEDYIKKNYQWQDPLKHFEEPDF